MSEEKPKGVRVEALDHHTFDGKAYKPGDKYIVHGDGHQTVEQYLDTLRARRFALPVSEEEPAVVEEVGEAETSKKDAPKADKSTHVEPMGTEDMKSAATAKQVEHRKQNVPTVKK